jgi:DNA-binding CsgD family transcriptional regulator
VVLGKNNVEIRDILGINVTTVKNHLQYAFRKLDTYGRVLAAVRWDRLKRS